MLVQWDSPLLLIGELALSVMVIAVIMFVAQLVNKKSEVRNQKSEIGEQESEDNMTSDFTKR